jgi:hypothetical protein
MLALVMSMVVLVVMVVTIVAMARILMGMVVCPLVTIGVVTKEGSVSGAQVAHRGEA